MTAVPNKDLADWVALTSNALSILQTEKDRKCNNANVGAIGQTLTEDQKIGRELYLFSEINERRSQASQIYANVGLACLGIRRLLQVCHHIHDNHFMLFSNTHCRVG